MVRSVGSEDTPRQSRCRSQRSRSPKEWKFVKWRRRRRQRPEWWLKLANLKQVLLVLGIFMTLPIKKLKLPSIKRTYFHFVHSFPFPFPLKTDLYLYRPLYYQRLIWLLWAFIWRKVEAMRSGQWTIPYRPVSVGLLLCGKTHESQASWIGRLSWLIISENSVTLIIN